MADFAALFDRKRKLEAEPMPAGAKAPKRQSTQGQASPEPGKKKKKKKKKNEHQPDAQHAGPLPKVTDASSSSAKGDRRQQRMAAQLAGASFRYINETLYTRPSEEAVELFRDEPRLYEAYHEGFRLQAARWPQRPVQLIAEWLKATQPRTSVVADLGCGDAELAASVPQRVHSFDLVACNERVTACDIAHVPLGAQTVHVAVFCLALMGCNFVDFLGEAHRLLKPHGILKIAEVSSRITDAEGWDRLLHALGFDEVARDSSNTHFVLFDYVKSDRPPASLPAVALKPCVYKKR